MPLIPPRQLDGTIYFGSDDKYVYALNPDGSQKWDFETGSEVNASPAIGSNGDIYIGSQDENLYSFDSNGNLNWSYDVGSETTPIINYDGTIIIARSQIHSLSSNGVILWRQGITPMLNTPIIDLDGIIYLGSSNTSDMIPIGDFYALDSNGNRIKNYGIGPIGENRSERHSPVISSLGIIYINTLDGFLHAIYSCGSGLANSPWPKFQHDNQNTGCAGN